MSKKKTSACRSPDEGGADRLSGLPDVVLCRILSFLDTKYAVSTSALSKRWKDLFISVPDIILDDSLVWKKEMGEDSGLEFAMFGLRQIMLRSVPYINRFHLKCAFNIKVPIIREMVFTAVWRYVREIDICMTEHEKFASLPDEIFTCKSLVVLKLEAYELGSLDVPDLVVLPKLKVLYLDGFVLDSDDSARRLFRGCRLLEELCLFNCEFQVGVLEISFPFLKKLFFDEDEGTLCTDSGLTEFVVDTPNLEYFGYDAHHIGKAIFMKGLTGDAKAVISLSCSECKINNPCQFINNLRGFKSLYLSSTALEAMYPEGSLPSAINTFAFKSLTTLTFGAYNLLKLLSILEFAPRLEVLIIHDHCADYTPCSDDDEKEDDDSSKLTTDLLVPFSPPETVPVCLANHLKIVEFDEFCENDQEFGVVKYIMQNGSALKRMSFTDDISKAAREKILMFPRGSKTCEVLF